MDLRNELKFPENSEDSPREEPKNLVKTHIQFGANPPGCKPKRVQVPTKIAL
jgi:hypothetical protein